MLDTLQRPQLEGIDRVRALNSTTNHWGFVNCGVGRLFLAGNDDGIAARFLHGYVYEPVSLGLWQTLCHEADVVVDVGAHTGIYSLAAFHSGANAVVSIEPYFLNAARLQLNLRANRRRLDGCAVVAASDVDGVTWLCVPISSGYCTGASRLRDFPGAVKYPVETRRLDTLVADHSSVRAIKLDVEYHLIAALRGAPGILAHQPDLIFEAFEDEIDDLLAHYDYRFWRIDEQAGLRPVDDIAIAPPDGDRNYFASVRPPPSEWLAMPEVA